MYYVNKNVFNLSYPIGFPSASFFPFCACLFFAWSPPMPIIFIQALPPPPPPPYMVRGCQGITVCKQTAAPLCCIKSHSLLTIVACVCYSKTTSALHNCILMRHTKLQNIMEDFFNQSRLKIKFIWFSCKNFEEHYHCC